MMGISGNLWINRSVYYQSWNARVHGAPQQCIMVETRVLNIKERRAEAFHMNVIDMIRNWDIKLF